MDQPATEPNRERPARAGGRMIPLQAVDKDITGHRLVCAEKENREQRPLLLAADIQGMAIEAGLDRPE